MSLGELREAAIIASVIDRASQVKRFCGETFIQKSTFFLKELFRIPFEAKFHLYYYGPFSFELRDQLRSMEVDDIVRVKSHEWGATFVTGDRFAMLQRQFPVTLKKYEKEMDFVVRELATLSVKELEPLATALFITREHPGRSVENRATDLHVVKPHIDMTLAQASTRRIDEWIAKYSPAL